MNQLTWTAKTPTETGQYWFCDFWNGPNPTEIVEVTKYDGSFWANGIELNFQIKKANPKKPDALLWKEALALNERGEPDKIKYNFWCKIPVPEAP